MEIIRGIHNLKPRHRGCVATVGNFDGVHLGHQAVIRQLIGLAQSYQLPSVLMTFEPQAMEFFQPQLAPARLTKFREKLEAMADLGVDRILCVRFNQTLADLSAEDFVQQALVAGLGIKHLVVGDDFHFGKGRSGNFDFLQNAGQRLGFVVDNTDTFDLDGARVSSTRIRQALHEGDLGLAESLLGRCYSMAGKVAHGDKRGRTIGFPTANIYLHRQNTPVKGVYAVQMTLDRVGGPVVVNGVANIGNRPTVDGTRTLLEVHLFDFKQDIYGAHVDVVFKRKLRDEQRFDSFEALKERIQLDVLNARAFFSSP